MAEQTGPPKWWYVCDVVVKSAAGAAALAVLLFINWPERRDNARLSGAQSEVAEHKAAQLKKPILQVLPGIAQSESVEDVREIRLSLKLSNVGGSDAVVRRIEVQVDNGAAKGDAEQSLLNTRRFYHWRIAQTQLPIPEPDSESRFQEQQATYDAEAESANSLTVPFHDPCPHGQLFSISSESPDIEWKTIENATQTLEHSEVIGPKQSASHHFTYVLTELPLQHHRQWLRFRVTVSQADSTGLEQRFNLYVSGLPLPEGPTMKMVAESRSSESTVAKPSYWQPEAPLLPVESNR